MKQRNGKNSKLDYYIANAFRYIFPDFICRIRLKKVLSEFDNSQDKAYIKDRVNYYNKLKKSKPLSDKAEKLSVFKLKGKRSAYFFDTYEYVRWFDKSNRMDYVFGDVTYVPDTPSIVKSRPIAGDNENSVLLNLVKVRHFTFLNDRIPFREKADKFIFRGHIIGKPNRIKFMEMFFNHPMCDSGIINHSPQFPKEWTKRSISLWVHLDYKFVMALEGNDVASNLKWIMSSNSVAVMPKPTYETWFMEGRLIPDYHYIEIKDDFSDLIEKINYYIEHPKMAESIINNAHEYIAQFKNKKREKLISLMVLNKYFCYGDKKQ